MDRVRVLENEVEAKRKQVKGILAAAATAKRNLTEDEAAKVEAIGAELEAVRTTLKAELRALEWDRDGAPAIDRARGEGGMAADDEAPALALPKLPARTRAKLQAMAAGRGSSAALPDRHEHFAAVVRAAFGGDPFVPALAASGNEAVGSEGGFAVRSDVSADIFTRAAEESVFARIGARLEPMESDLRTVVALDDDDESADKEAGLQAGWTGEGSEATAQVMNLRAVTLSAKKLMVLAAISSELAEDAMTDFLAQLEAAIGRAIGKKFDRAILSGTGAAQPLGLLNAPATIEVSKTVDNDPGASNTLTFRHVAAMWSRLAPGSHERAWWLMHPTVLPQALSMKIIVQNVAGTENVGGFQPASAFQAGGPTGYMLLGRPVVITGRVKPLSSRGDVLLVDPSQVALGIRRTITIDRSASLYFSSDRLAIRGKFRGDALPMWEGARTLQEGSTTVSPYVVLQAR